MRYVNYIKESIFGRAAQVEAVSSDDENQADYPIEPIPVQINFEDLQFPSLMSGSEAMPITQVPLPPTARISLFNERDCCRPVSPIVRALTITEPPSR